MYVRRRAVLGGALLVLLAAVASLALESGDSGWAQRLASSAPAGQQAGLADTGIAGDATTSTLQGSAITTAPPTTTLSDTAATTAAPDGTSSSSASATTGPADELDPDDESPPITLLPRPTVTITVPQTTQPPVTQPPTSGVTRRPDLEGVLLQKHNAARAAAGLPGLSRSSCLDSVAAGWTERQAINDAMAHNPNYAGQIDACFTWSGVAENVGWSDSSIDTVFSWWMGSTVHKNNILTPDFTAIGIGVYESADGTIYSTVNFAR